MKTKFIDAINYYAAKDLEFDAVIGNEEMPATFSFDGTPTFTEYCMAKYGDLLNSDCEIKPDTTGRYTDAIIVNYDDANKGKDFALAWAGYVNNSEYENLFGKG